MVGVVDFDGKSLYLAEQDDNGFYTGRLTAPDTLELIYVEAAQAAVYRAQLTPRSSLGRASPPEKIAATTWHFGVYRH